MKYGKVVSGKFISRPNRFIAIVETDEGQEVVHVKNTGRCRELLIPGCRVFLEKSENPSRKTKYDLIAAEKGDLLINMDSQAPNKVVGEWIVESGYFGEIKLLRPEFTYGGSRVDFYLESSMGKILIEVKGVTLENEGVVSFPDAPTERGIKHLRELSGAIDEGYLAYVIFVVQMDEALYFTPNEESHPGFARALREAVRSGVTPLAITCNVEKDCLTAKKLIDIRL